MRLLLRQGLRHHTTQPLQSLLTVLGIASGVALLCAMRLSQTTAERAFDRAVAAVAGSATHTITDAPRGLPSRAYAALRRQLGGDVEVTPTVLAIARTTGSRASVLRVLGIDPFGGAAMRPWAGPSAPGVPLARLVTEPGTFVCTDELRRRLGIIDGASVHLSIGGRPFEAHCIGVIAPPDDVRAGLADTLVVDIATAQEWCAAPDRIDRLDVRLPEDRDERALHAAVAEACGDGVRIERAGSNRRGLAQLTRGFRINVTALSLLSLLVGAFLVHETMRLSVVARRSTFGVLRALGAAGHQLAVTVAVEAVVLGVLGSALGVLLGTLAAKALLEPIVRTLNDHYATFALPTLEVDAGELLLAAAGGLCVSILAALAPAARAARTPPRQTMITAHANANTAAPDRRWLWALLPALAGGALLIDVGDDLVRGYLGLAMLLLVAVMVTPALLRRLLQLLSLPLRRLGPFARYVARSTIAARDHVALPVAAMVLAVATTIGMAVLVGSFRDSVTGWLAQVLPAEVYVSVPGGVDERGQTIDPAIIAQLRDAPGVAAVTSYHRTTLPFAVDGHDPNDDTVEVVGMQPSEAWLDEWPLLAGDRSRARRALLDAEPMAWISEPLAFRCDLTVGDRITLSRAPDATPLEVCAIYRDYANERGEVLVSHDWLERATGDAGVTALGLEAAPESDVDALCATLRERATRAADQSVLVRSTRELKSTSLAIFDRTFAITGVMRILCLLVAFFGIYSAFASLQFERAAEIGLLRCLGARPSRIAVVVLGQTALLGISAALLAVPLGIALGHLLAHVINRVSFGWSLTAVTIPPMALVEAATLAVLAAVLAGLWPARRFARMRPADALRTAS